MSESGADEGIRRKRAFDRVRLSRRHRAAVMDAEVRLLVHALAPFGLLPREELVRCTHATLWHEGTFDAALAVAVERGRIEILPGDLVILRRRWPLVRRRQRGGELEPGEGGEAGRGPGS